jgi:exodeoxyribonuclease V alpha subunit
VWGIGFKTADTIAQAVGIPHDSPERVKAGLQYTLSQATDNGHCYLPAAQPDRRRAKILDVPARPGRARAWTTRRRGGRGPREPCPGTAAASPVTASTWCRSTAPNSPSPAACCGCCDGGPDAAFHDVDWDKALAWLQPAPAPTSPPSRRRRSGSR